MQFNKTTLPNGLRVITVPMIDNPAVTVLVMVETGSKYETKETNGLSHFLEHMMFKGTSRRPRAIDIARELDTLGAHYNAFTSQEYTGYYAKVAVAKLDNALDIVADLFQNPLLDPKEMEKEKGVIIEEIRMYQDLPQRDVEDVLSALMFGDQPSGWPIIGSEQNVRSFTREQLMGYRSSHYVSSASTVVISGSFDEQAVLAKVSEVFGTLPATPKKGKLSVLESQTTPALRAKFKETDQTYLAMAFRAFPVLDARIPAMRVLSNLLGSGMSSRLFTKMRSELGICYYVNAGYSAYTDHGDLSISAGVDSTRIEQGIRGILDECVRLKNELVSDDELARVKDNIAGTAPLELETSDARAEYCGYQEVLKHAIESPDQSLAKIRAVTAVEVRDLARQIFTDAGLNMAIIGRYPDERIFKPYFTVN